MKNNTRSFATIVLGASMLTLVSCGDDQGSDVKSSQASRQEESQEGIFRAELNTLNGDSAGEVSGFAEIRIENGEFIAEVEIDGAPADIIHAQHIHAADSCPGSDADANGDGFIDVVEGVPTYGPILVPLDGDLGTQAAGAEGFPTADATGSYFYSQSVSLDEMLEDLTAEDPDPSDAVAKLEGDNLNIEGRHIVIHGVPADSELPESVASIGDLPSHATLPIACGELRRIEGSGTESSGSKN